jgi:hypothetical protein
MKNVRLLLCVAAIGAIAAAAVGAASVAPATAGGVAVSTCRERGWCTVTAAGYVTPTASQLAIGNVRGGTPLAVTQVSVGQRQVGGQVLAGSLVGTCVWSQYQRDWSAPVGSASAQCPAPVLDTAAFVADGGNAIWSGCFPRCFGGVPVRFDRRCGTHGRSFCYSRDCEEYANFFPWSPRAHPLDPIRLTGHHVLDVRYLARYPDYLNGHPYYMVRDVGVFHGTGNWVFISAKGCGIVVGRTGAYHSEPRHGRRRPVAA